MTEKQPKILNPFEMTQAIDPERDAASVAVDFLTDPEDMSAFIKEYAKDLFDNTREPGTYIDSLNTALQNVSYFASHKSQTVPGKWLEVIDEIRAAA